MCRRVLHLCCPHLFEQKREVKPFSQGHPLGPWQGLPAPGRQGETTKPILIIHSWSLIPQRHYCPLPQKRRRLVYIPCAAAT